MGKQVRVRFAPSPTGFIHIGGIYQVLLDYAFAKKHNGKFFIRIEDTDQKRYVEGAEEKIFEAIDWFDLPEDESVRKHGPFGPYRQSQRLDLYQKYALELIEKGGAYYCFCTVERLETLRKEQEKAKKPSLYDKHCRHLSQEEINQKLATEAPHVIRLKIPENTTITVRDELRGEIKFDSNLIEDAVLLKSDGYPTYHLASSVVDDHLMETTHVTRGEEWLSSLPLHWVAYDYFGWQKPLFYHTPILRNPDRTKLSKRQGHTNVDWYRNEGYLPEAVRNFIAYLTWTHPQEKEIYSLEEFITLFDLNHIRTVGAVFDLQKLAWMNGEYIRAMDTQELINKLKDFYKNDTEVLTILTNSSTKLLIELAKTRMKTLKEFRDLVTSQEVSLSPEEKAVANLLKEKFAIITEWTVEAILTAMREVLKEKKVKGNILYKIITGREKGLPLPESLQLLGKEGTLQRFE